MATTAVKKAPVARKTRVSTVPENETKQQKFVRLANRRVNKVCKALDQIGLLGGASYDSTEDQQNKIIAAIQEAFDYAANRLRKVKSSKTNFRL